MLLAQAHSFTQQARLAVTLAWIAGYTNVLTILLCGHVTSHVSGTTSDFGRAAVETLRGSEGAWPVAGFALFLLVTFFVGATLSGITTELGRRRRWESLYVLPMAFEAMLLAAFAIIAQQSGAAPAAVAGAAAPLSHGWTLYLLTGLASVAMGLQNATITRISSGVVRTTHVTGVLTDLGLEFVQFLEWMWERRREVMGGPSRELLRGARAHPTPRRLALLVSILGSFALGAGLGTLAFDHILGVAMYLPVLFLAWIIYQDIAQPIAEIEASELVGEHEGLALPEAMAIFRLRRDAGGRSGLHRLPSLLAWADRLPPGVRVAILDLHDVTQLDHDAPAEIKAALTRFRHEGRTLLLAGVSGDQFARLRQGGVGDLLHADVACADLEIAIARAFNILQDLDEESRRAKGTRGSAGRLA